MTKKTKQTPALTLRDGPAKGKKEIIMKRFDDYEIHPVVCVGETCIEYEQASPADPVEAHCWSLYGHVPGEGVQCIGDFTTYEAAAEIYCRITGREHGLRFEDCSPEMQRSYGRPSGKKPGPTIDERAEHAGNAMAEYLSSKGEPHGQPAEEHEISDLICDLLHLSDRLGFETDLQLVRAQEHYEAEKEEGG